MQVCFLGDFRSIHQNFAVNGFDFHHSTLVCYNAMLLLYAVVSEGQIHNKAIIKC